MKTRGFLLVSALCLFTHTATAQQYGPHYNGTASVSPANLDALVTADSSTGEVLFNSGGTIEGDSDMTFSGAKLTVTDISGATTIDAAGTLTGAQYECINLFPTTPDGDVVAGTNQYRVTLRSAFTVTDAYAYVSTSGTTSAITVDYNESGTSILSTKQTIDAGENDSTTAVTPAVISDTALAANAVISMDTDSADSGNTGAGLIGQLCGYYN